MLQEFTLQKIPVAAIAFISLVMMLSPAHAREPRNPPAKAGTQVTETPAPMTLTLDAAVKMALGQHPNLRAARGVTQQSEAVVRQRRSAYWPQIDGNLAYSRIKRSFVGGVTRGATANLFSDYEAGFRGSQLLYDFGRTSNDVRAAQRQVDVDRLETEATAQDVVANTKVAYFGVLQGQQLLQVSDEDVASLKEHLRQAQGFYEVGLRPKIDVTRAEVDLSQGEADRVAATGNLRVSRATLVNAMGVSLPQGFQVADVPLMELMATLDVVLRLAYDQRPEIRQAEAVVRRVDAELSRSQAGYWPTLTGNGAWFYEGSQFPLGNNWDIGATLNMNLFDGFLVRNQVSEAKAALLTAKAREDRLKQDVRLDVERNYSDTVTARERLAAAEAAVRSATENLELARGRYQEGLGSAIEFTDAQLSLTQARADRVTAFYELLSSLGRLERSVGAPMDLFAGRFLGTEPVAPSEMR